MSDYAKAIKNFEQNDMKRLKEARETLSKIANDESKDNQQYNKLRSEVEEIRNNFSQQEVVKRELDDNKRLREKKVDYESKVSVLNEFKQKLISFVCFLS